MSGLNGRRKVPRKAPLTSTFVPRTGLMGVCYSEPQGEVRERPNRTHC